MVISSSTASSGLSIGDCGGGGRGFNFDSANLTLPDLVVPSSGSCGGVSSMLLSVTTRTG